MRLRMNGTIPTSVLIMVAALSVLAKLVSGHNLFLVLFLLVSCYGILKERTEDKIIFLLFFSTWIYVLKFDGDRFSFFHIIQFVYLLSCLFSMLNNKIRVSLTVIIGFLFFALYILLTSGFASSNNSLVIVGFLLNFLTIAVASATLNENASYERYVLSYASGLVFSGLVALLGRWIPEVEQYIQNMGETYTLYENNHLYTRFSGLDVDPNYFSLQVLVAIALLLVVSGYKKQLVKESVLILVLAFMGLHTLSKMFLLMVIIILIYVCIIYVTSKYRSVMKYLFALTVLILIAMPFGLLDFIVVTIARFSEQGGTVVSVTTGRSSLWVAYLQEITANPRIFLIGNGIGTGFLDGYAAHNMYLSYWYFTGFLGIVALLVFVAYSYNHMKKTTTGSIKMAKRALNSLPLFVVIVANFSLDSIVMDFFPLVLFLSLLSLNHVKV
ncbi:hypothetical protein [Sporosarcina beigongshangi]|uniref:hypothetical protein n=1 Tax=Sporosarcina beigongshangi TaxID=2782538 RepID=UPI001939D161|nr:hypothetical protein [Sporosarcina beigongshangi]